MNIRLNEVFVITKGKRKARWKVIESPFTYGYALVRDHQLMYTGKQFIRNDVQHIVFSGPPNLETMYRVAYDHT